MTTHDLIKQLRALGLSQSEISRKTGIPQPRLSRWEGGAVPDAADDSLKLRALLENTTRRGKPKQTRAAASDIPAAPDWRDPRVVDRRAGDDRRQGERRSTGRRESDREHGG